LASAINENAWPVRYTKQLRANCGKIYIPAGLHFQAFVTPVVVVKKYLQNAITCNKTAHIPVRSERQAVEDFWNQLHDSLLLIKDTAPPQINLFEAFVLKEYSTYYGLYCTNCPSSSEYNMREEKEQKPPLTLISLWLSHKSTPTLHP